MNQEKGRKKQPAQAAVVRKTQESSVDETRPDIGLLQALFDITPGIQLIIDLDHDKILHYNPGALALLKYSGEELRSMSITDLCPKRLDDRKETLKKFYHYLTLSTEGKPAVFECCLSNATK